MGIGLDGIAKAEIKNKINKLKREIQELEQIKEKYKKMNNKIEYALQKLKSAETYKNDSFNSFKRNYSSDESNKILSEFKETMNNIDIIEKEGYEGDDILGTLAKYGEAQGLDVTILSVVSTIAATDAAFCNALLETLRGRSGQSITPLRRSRNSGITSFMLSATNT